MLQTLVFRGGKHQFHPQRVQICSKCTRPVWASQPKNPKQKEEIPCNRWKTSRRFHLCDATVRKTEDLRREMHHSPSNKDKVTLFCSCFYHLSEIITPSRLHVSFHKQTLQKLGFKRLYKTLRSNSQEGSFDTCVVKYGTCKHSSDSRLLTRAWGEWQGTCSAANITHIFCLIDMQELTKTWQQLLLRQPSHCHSVQVSSRVHPGSNNGCSLTLLLFPNTL